MPPRPAARLCVDQPSVARTDDCETVRVTRHKVPGIVLAAAARRPSKPSRNRGGGATHVNETDPDLPAAGRSPRCCLQLAAVPAMAAGGTAAKVALGAMLAGDRSLSAPDGQACADCHFPKAGYSDPDADLPVSQGVDPTDFGGRNAPTWAYTAWSPDLHFDGEAWVGGMFWDGRASGWQLSPLAEQARGPFLNPVEMQNPSKAEVIREVRRAPYSALFRLGLRHRQPQERRRGVRRRGPRDRSLRIVGSREHVQFPLRRVHSREPARAQHPGEARP